ncbi:mechanosensitive ion channel family protein [Pseudoduganella sp. GCM10020061]|uniref:mechanosensitive ion channel family protein n=1 Tax=Pseudoduganella sp. GCM10020061 TaxID=3317345 RepID=UPI003629B9E8
MPISSLLTDLLNDLRDPAVLWQAAVIAACVIVGWGLAHLLRRAWQEREERLTGHPVVRIVGTESFERVLTPVMVLTMLAIARFSLAGMMNVSLLRIAMPLASSLAIIRFAFYMLRRVFARHGRIGGALVTFERVFALLVWIAVALYILGAWPDIFHFLESTTVPLGKNEASLAAIFKAIVSVVVLLMLSLWAGAALEDRLMNVEGVHLSLRAAVARVSRAVLVVVSVLMSLTLVGIDLTVLSVFGGALGVGLGLGLQKIASNYVSGFVVLLERRLSMGDMIKVDKFDGRVAQINTRYTVLAALDGSETVVPNEMLIANAVQNFSLPARRVRVATQLTVAYDTDIDKLLPALGEACVGIERVLADPAPGALVLRFGPDGFDLEVGMFIADPEAGSGGILSEANVRIWRVLQEQGVSLPYPTRDIRIVQDQRPASETGHLATQ